MANLHQVIYLRATPNAGFTDSRTVDGCVSLNLDVVFQNNFAGLSDFLIATFGSLRESKSISTDYHTILQPNAVTDF